MFGLCVVFTIMFNAYDFLTVLFQHCSSSVGSAVHLRPWSACQMRPSVQSTARNCNMGLGQGRLLFFFGLRQRRTLELQERAPCV